MSLIKILHTTTTVGKASFGIGQISVSLARAQHDLNNDVAVWCLDSKTNIIWASKNHGFSSDFITGFELAGPKKLWFSPDIKKKARDSNEKS